MFTGFNTENTPAIQVWNFFQPGQSTTSSPRVSLTDDCAPIQYFKTGYGTGSIIVYLPTCPIEGKIIKIVNHRYASQAQVVILRSSDTSDGGSNLDVYKVPQGGYVDIIYTKQAISFGTSSGQYASGWLSLNQGASVANNYLSFNTGLTNQSTGAKSAIVGGQNNTASGSDSAVLGGSGNTASAFQSAVIGGINATASGYYSAALASDGGTVSGTASSMIATGSSSSVSGNNSAAIATTGASVTSDRCAVLGGVFNTASNSNCVVVGGVSNTSSGGSSVVIGGSTNTANGVYSIVAGGSYGTTRSISGNFVTPSSAPIAGSSGVSQAAILVLGVATSDATVTTLRSDNAAAGTTNQVILPNNSAYYFRGSVIANVTGGGNTKAWTFEGAIKRGANAAATSIVGAVITNTIAQDSGASTWTISVAADTTNGGLRVQVTGQAATTIRWVCKVETTEVTF